MKIDLNSKKFDNSLLKDLFSENKAFMFNF